MRLALALAALVVLAGCSPARLLNAFVPTRGFELRSGLSYGEHPRQRLDVYVPRAEGTQKLPVVVFFYGGSWKAGERASYLFVAEALAARGFVVVVPDYRVHPEVRYPAFMEDAARAVAWAASAATRSASW